MTLPSRPLRLLLLVAPLALLGAACGDDDDDTTTASTAGGADTTDTTAASESTDTTAAAGGVTVEVADSDHGQILVSDGRTLYQFLPDNAGPSTCTDACADTWPALTSDGGVEAGDGVDAGLLATTTRDDGTEQVTVDGWPLYFFSGDAAPGDANGQGIGGNWYVVAPDGTAIT